MCSELEDIIRNAGLIFFPREMSGLRGIREMEGIDKNADEGGKERGRFERLRPAALKCKKRRHERSSCSWREASDANYFRPGGGFGNLSTTGINTR
jgi:hypothetical protein